MKLTYYVPIYQWGDDPYGVSGIAYGRTVYNDLNELYGMEQDVVGHMELNGVLPTENEFKTQIQTWCGAV